MTAYFSKMKRLADSLAIVGKPVEHNDLITYILTGLDSQDYESLVTTLLAKGENMSLDELYAVLLSHEMRLDQKKGKLSDDVMHNLTTNVAQKNQGFYKGNFGYQRGIGGLGGNTQNNFGNGSNGGNNMPFKPNIVCQICFIPGHGATKCKNRYNSAFVPQRGPGRGNFRPVFNQYGRGFNQNNAGQRPFNNFGRGGNGAFSGNCAFSKGFGYQGYQGHTVYPEPIQSDHVAGIPFGSFHSGPSNPAAFNCYNGVNNDQKFNQNQNSVAPFISSPEVIEDPSWYIDSGASSHITNDSGKLLDLQPYFGSEELLVGNGNGLKIKHIGSVLLATYSHKPLLLNHVLHVHHITKNLLSVSQLLTDNNVLVEFVDNFCLIKARNTRILLLRGIANEGLYQIQDVISSNLEVSKPNFLSLLLSNSYS